MSSNIYIVPVLQTGEIVGPEFHILRCYLKTKGLKITAQRETILEAFLQCDGHIHIEELLEKVQKRDPSIGIATVYRTVNILKECGLLNDQLLHDGKKVLEKLYRKAHHDHLLCNQCGKLEEFEPPLIEKYQKEVAQQYGFVLNSHRMILYGLCWDCKKE